VGKAKDEGFQLKATSEHLGGGTASEEALTLGRKGWNNR